MSPIITLLGLLPVLVARPVLLPAQADSMPPYRNAALPVDQRVSDLLGRMTLQEKFWQLFMLPGATDDPGADYSHGVFGLQVRSPADSLPDLARRQAERINTMQRYLTTQTRLGIPMIPFEEALHGLTSGQATVFPQAIGLAATWDTALMQRVAMAIARETRSRGIRQVLSPVINIASDVRWGRTEETYGEDPWLASAMANAYITPFEALGVIATPKHLVANVGDGGRDSYPIDHDPRALGETFFPPFVSAVEEAHAGSVMAAYNSVDGVPASQNHWLLTDVLRNTWNFQGFVISDAAATGGATVLHLTEASTATATRDALNAGLDVIFQTSYPQYRPYYAAFERGMIAESVIDRAVSRVLRAKFAIGLFDHPFVDPDSAAYLNRNPAHRAAALDAARESIVLLKNAGRTLPVSATVRSIAVIGVDAVEGRFGGYSGTGGDKITILDGIRARAGNGVTVRYAPGPGRVTPAYVTVPSSAFASPTGDTTGGLHGEYFDNITLAGAPRLVRRDPTISFGWTLNSPGRGIPYDWYSVRWTGSITAPDSGVREIGIEGNDGYRVFLDDRLLIDDWEKQSYGTRLRRVDLAPGSRHRIRVEYFESTGNARIKLVWNAGIDRNWQRSIDSAVAIARQSSVAIVVPGLEEGEFRDRASLALPGHQEELIRAVAGTGTPVVVLLIGGSAVTMSRWLDSVSAIMDAWYPGEVGGQAVADVLFGDYDPAGRLPITFPIAEGQLPLVYNHRPTGRGDDYEDLTGMALFPFGFGLSYTSFEYSALSFDTDTIAPDGRTTVHCVVRNTGLMAGDEVVQLYLHDLLATTARPVMQLEGFQRVHLAPGESRTVSFVLGSGQLHMLDESMHWVVESGTFRVMIGASSKDIRLRGDLIVR